MTRIYGVLAVLAAASAHAEPATARYAPVQLEIARAELEEARAAAALGERARARQLAAQAELDARLAWRMSDVPVVRMQAAEVFGAAAGFSASFALEQASAGR